MKIWLNSFRYSSVMTWVWKGWPSKFSTKSSLTSLKSPLSFRYLLKKLLTKYSMKTKKSLMQTTVWEWSMIPPIILKILSMQDQYLSHPLSSIGLRQLTKILAIDLRMHGPPILGSSDMIFLSSSSFSGSMTVVMHLMISWQSVWWYWMRLRAGN